MHQDISGSQLKVIANSGHFPFLDNWEEFAKRNRSGGQARTKDNIVCLLSAPDPIFFLHVVDFY